MATSALAPTGPFLCSFISLLPPSEQAQHFKSCFPAAGRKLSSLCCLIRSSRMGFSSYFPYSCFAPYLRVHTYILRMSVSLHQSLISSCLFVSPLHLPLPSVFRGNSGPGPGVLRASERPAGQRLTSDSEGLPTRSQVRKSHLLQSVYLRQTQEEHTGSKEALTSVFWTWGSLQLTSEWLTVKHFQ